MERRQPSFVTRWWLPLSALAIALLLVGAKLGIRSVATGQPVLPGVSGAPVLGPGPTPSPTPRIIRVGLRVHVTDPAGQPVSQAIVEVHDKFNTPIGSQETGTSGEAIIPVPPNPAYVVTARKPGFTQAKQEGVDVEPPSLEAQAEARATATAAALPGAAPGAAFGRRGPLQVVDIQLGIASALASGSASAAGATSASGTGSVTSGLERLYVGHSLPRVSLIDAASDLLLKHSDGLGQGRLTLLAVSKDRSQVYAAWSGSPAVLVLDGNELTVQRQVSVGEGTGVTALAVNPQSGRLWISTSAPDATDSGVLFEFDAAAQQVARRVPVGPAVFGMRFRPDGSALFLPQRTSNTLSLVEPGSGAVAGKFQLAQWPSDYSLSADGRSLFLVNIGSDKLMEIDASTGALRRSLDVGNGASGVLADPGGAQLFVANQMFGYVQVIDLATWQVTDLVPVGRSPQGMTLSPDGKSLYVANAGSGTISVVDLATRTLRDTLSIGGAPSSLLLATG